MKNLAYTLLLTFILPLSVIAQISKGGSPASFELKELESSVGLVSMESVDMEMVLEEDSLDELRGRPMRFGVAHDISLSMAENASWEISDSGIRVARLKIQCPDALSINLIYDQFHLPEGGSLYIYSEDHSYTLGAFTSSNHKEDGTFSTGLVPGELITVEYNAPEALPLPEIVIGRVVHGYRDFFNFEKNFGDSGPCNNNVNCPEGAAWTDQINSVAMIVLAGGTRWCTGAMVNNTCEDGSPLFLTANHCLTGSGVNNWMFYFNYQSPSCSNIDGPTNQIVSGARLLSTSPVSDFALLELSAPPPVSYNAYYAGWSNINASTDTSVGIHHPRGDIKKISFSNQQTPSTLYLSNTVDTNHTHWRVPTWDDGTTEGGSSGSPLFNTEKQIVGQLHGGYASCTSITSDWYGKFSYSWDKGSTLGTRLKDWLDPSQINLDTIGGSYFNFTPPLEASLSSLTIPERTCLFTQVPEVQVKNSGTDTIQSLQIAWSISGTVQDTLTWIGQILPNGRADIMVDTVVLSPGNFWLSAEILTVNGQTDLNSCNNLKSKSFEVVNGSEVAFRLRTDNWPEETSVVVEDTSGNTIYSLSTFQANKLDTFYFCLEPGCYNITIFDSYGDGLVGGGFYELIYQDSIVHSGSGAFGNCTGSFMSAGCSVLHALCTDSASINQSPVAAFTISDTLYSLGDSVIINDLSSNFPDTWSWRITHDSITYSSTDQNPMVIPGFVGYYDVELIASNFFGSDSISLAQAFRVKKESALSSQELSQSIRIYPNPAGDFVNVEIFSISEFSGIKIMDINGKEHEIEIANSENKIGFDTSRFPRGLYFIQLSSEGYTVVKRLMLK